METTIYFIAMLFVAACVMQFSKKRSKNTASHQKKSDVLLFDEEKQIRSAWLRSMYTFLFGNLGVSILCYFFLIYSMDFEVANEFLFDNLALRFFLCLKIFLIYVVAYVQFGTILLALMLFITPIKLLLDIAPLIEMLTPLSLINGVFALGTAFEIILTAYFWIQSKKIYHLNVKIKKRTSPLNYT